MSELSPRAQALVRGGRAAFRPKAEDRSRVLSGLRARLAPPAPAPVSVQAPRGLWLAASAALVSAGVAAAVAVRSQGEPAPAAPSSLHALPAPAAAVSQVPTAGLEPPAQPEAVAPAPSSPATRRAPDRLAEEVAILTQAAKDLRGGRAEGALRALNDHQRRFPSGLLALERRAARAEALCTLGRFAEADVELSTLNRAAPSSPLTVRAEQRCAARPAKPR